MLDSIETVDDLQLLASDLEEFSVYLSYFFFASHRILS